jgi:hypothetical protein
VRCFLQEYLALRQLPIIGRDGAVGRLLGMTFAEPDWNVVSVLVDFGRVLRLAPAELLCTSDEPPGISLKALGAGASAELGGGRQLNAADIDADNLLTCHVVSSRDDAVGGRIADLLINLDQWQLRYFVVDNGTCRVLLDVAWVTGISTKESCVIIDGLPSNALATAPEYSGLGAMSPGFEDTIYRHYTRRDLA